MSPIVYKFGCVIRRHRRARGLSQEALADLSGISRSHLGKVELGASMPSIATAERLARALGKSLASLIMECEEVENG